MTIPVKYETQLDYQYMQPLFNARKVLTDQISGNTNYYVSNNKNYEIISSQVEQLDNLILKLAGKL